MKKIACILSAFMLLSCYSGSIKKEIIGEWEIVEFKLLNMKIDGDFAQMEKISLSTTYTFISNNTVNVKGDVQGDVNGNYVIENDSITLSYKIAGNELNEKFKIIDFTKNRMIFEQSFKDYGDFNFILNRIQE